MLRTADGLGVAEIILCGITPYPSGGADDQRLPHVAKRAEKLIDKTALGAQHSTTWRHAADTLEVIADLHARGYTVACIEQAPESILLDEFAKNLPDKDVAIIVGPEVDGISADVLTASDVVVEIPMRGAKESFNVSITAAIAMYELAKA